MRRIGANTLSPKQGTADKERGRTQWAWLFHIFIYKLRIYTLLIKKKIQNISWSYMTFTCENLHNIFNNLQMLYLHKKYISLQKFCNYVHIQIHRFFFLWIWDNNCVVHLKAFYSSWAWGQVFFFAMYCLGPMRSFFHYYFFNSLPPLHIHLGKRNAAKYITYREHRTSRQRILSNIKTV